MSRCLTACAGIFLLAFLMGGCAREPERPAAPPDSSSVPAVVPDSLLADAAPAPPANPFAEPARRALRIELGLDAYRTVDGTWTAGDASSTYTAYFDGDSLRFIEEELSVGEYGDETSVYYFADGTLFYAVQDAVRVRLGADGAVRRDTVQFRVALTPSGGVHAAEGTVNGEPEQVDRVLIDGVRRHAEALYERTRTVTRPAL